MRSRSLRLAAVASLVATAAAGAQQAIPVEIHGFGSWNSGITNNDNHYLGAEKLGSTTNSTSGINLSGSPTDRTTFMTQVKFDFEGAETNVSLEYAFAEYKFTDALKLRAGQVRQPFGLYTEIIDIGTVRPFLAPPQSVYGPAGNIGEAYRGLGLTGSLPFGGGLGVDYDVYYGGLNRKEYELVLDAYRAAQGRRTWASVGTDKSTEITERVIGARTMFSLPVQGMRVGASYYHGDTGETSTGPGWVTTVGYSAEYAGSRTTLRAETVREFESDYDRQNGWYTEGSYRLFGNWQAAGQYSRATVNPKPAGTKCTVCVDHPEYAESLLRHDEAAVGLNYFFSPTFVLKTSYHHTKGNRFSLPTRDVTVSDLSAAEAAGATTSPLPDVTRALLFGAQFSF